MVAAPSDRSGSRSHAFHLDLLFCRAATVVRRGRGDDPDDAYYFAVMQDPEGNEFCVS